jgi:uncharacterized protein involved in exopolysaccharide biosynthesis
MDLLLTQLYALARRIWKYRWLGLALGWVFGVIGIVVAFAVPNRFEASARIYVDTQSILKPLMANMTVQPNVNEQVGMLSRTLISRPNVEKLIRMADLDLKKQTKAEQETLVDELTRSLGISKAQGDNLYTLSFKHEDPDTAKRAVASLPSPLMVAMLRKRNSLSRVSASSSLAS